MRIDFVTLFPGLVEAPFQFSLLQKARARGIFEVRAHDLRDYAPGRHRTCDDQPFGGGEGMVMKVEPIARALRSVRDPALTGRTLLMTPGGRPFHQRDAARLATFEQLVLLCGHYEGVDARVHEHLIDEEVSLGDFVLTGGELPALAVAEAVIRLLPGVVGCGDSLQNECFQDGLLDTPHYTRPRCFEGLEVPDVLLSGHHARVVAWRRREALRRTRRFRPELLEHAALTPDERAFVASLEAEPPADGRKGEFRDVPDTGVPES